jgi:hypothetical protein
MGSCAYIILDRPATSPVYIQLMNEIKAKTKNIEFKCMAEHVELLVDPVPLDFSDKKYMKEFIQKIGIPFLRLESSDSAGCIVS